MKVRFYGSSVPVNGPSGEWDFVEEFPTDVEASEAVQDYLCCHDDDLASHEVVEE